MGDTLYMDEGKRATEETEMDINLQELAAKTRAMNERVETCRECGHVANVTAEGFCEGCIEEDLACQARHQEWN